MKKLLLTLILTTLTLTLTACEYDWAHQNPQYLQDFNYLLQALEENFPYFGIAERRFGISLEQITENTRQAITAQPIRDTYHFISILNANFFAPMRSIGHLSIQDRGILHLILGNIYRGSLDFNGIPIDLRGYEHTYWGQKFIDMTRSETAQQFYGFIEVAEGYEPGMVRQNNLTTQIIGENIGYVRVSQFWHYNIDHDLEIMLDFYQQIQGFDNLIIDLRGNGGGMVRYFTQIFMAPIIPHDVEIPGIYNLLKAGSRNLAWVNAQIMTDYIFMQADTQKVPLPAYRFPYLADAHKFGYMLQSPIHVASTGQQLFDGKIWILVDHNSASAVEFAVMYAQSINFATIVGTPTRGVTGGGLAGFFPLPNTGIIIRYDYGFFVDSYGRAIDEHGVTPDHLNHTGMDALQTTLTLIQQQ